MRGVFFEPKPTRALPRAATQARPTRGLSPASRTGESAASAPLVSLQASDISSTLDLRARVADSPPARAAEAEEPVDVRVNEWRICEPGKRYVVDTAGCGAIKVFVRGSSGRASDYEIVFHSYGTPASQVAAGTIGDHIAARSQPPAEVRILVIMPYDVSAQVMASERRLQEVLSRARGLDYHATVVCLNNIEGEKNARFVRVDLTGTESEIVERCAPLTLRSPEMTEADRNAKIALFQSLPVDVRTPDFIRRWVPLTLDEARTVADGVRRARAPWWLRALGACCSTAPPGLS